MTLPGFVFEFHFKNNCLKLCGLHKVFMTLNPINMSLKLATDLTRKHLLKYRCQTGHVYNTCQFPEYDQDHTPNLITSLFSQALYTEKLRQLQPNNLTDTTEKNKKSGRQTRT